MTPVLALERAISVVGIAIRYVEDAAVEPRWVRPNDGGYALRLGLARKALGEARRQMRAAIELLSETH